MSMRILFYRGTPSKWEIPKNCVVYYKGVLAYISNISEIDSVQDPDFRCQIGIWKNPQRPDCTSYHWVRIRELTYLCSSDEWQLLSKTHNELERVSNLGVMPSSTIVYDGISLTPPQQEKSFPPCAPLQMMPAVYGHGCCPLEMMPCAYGRGMAAMTGTALGLLGTGSNCYHSYVMQSCAGPPAMQNSLLEDLLKEVLAIVHSLFGPDRRLSSIQRFEQTTVFEEIQRNTKHETVKKHLEDYASNLKDEPVTMEDEKLFTALFKVKLWTDLMKAEDPEYRPPWPPKRQTLTPSN